MQVAKQNKNFQSNTHEAPTVANGFSNNSKPHKFLLPNTGQKR